MSYLQWKGWNRQNHPEITRNCVQPECWINHFGSFSILFDNIRPTTTKESSFKFLVLVNLCVLISLISFWTYAFPRMLFGMRATHFVRDCLLRAYWKRSNARFKHFALRTFFSSWRELSAAVPVWILENDQRRWSASAKVNNWAVLIVERERGIIVLLTMF